MKYLEQLRRALVTHAGLIKTLGKLHLGDKIKVPHSVVGDIVFLVADKNHAGYPANSVTLITEKLDLIRCFDAREPENTGNERRWYGHDKYSLSNIDQWLNSSAAAGGWYSARHTYDQAPARDFVNNRRNAYDQDAGFLNGFSSSFVDSVMNTTITVALNPIDGGGSETIARKMFLASRAEVFGVAENNIMEGSLLALFSANTNEVRKAKVSAYAADHSQEPVNENQYLRWFMRTPDTSAIGKLRYVHANGSDQPGIVAMNSEMGIRPLCNLSSGLRVSDTTDADGCYTLMI